MALGPAYGDGFAGVSSPGGVVYVKGDADTEDSLRLMPDVLGENVEMQRLVSGVWNDTGLQIAASTVHLGRDLRVSGAGEWIRTFDVNSGETSLIPHVMYDDTGSEAPHVPVLSSKVIKDVLHSDESSEVIGTDLQALRVSAGDVLESKIYHKTGSVGATAPVVVTFYRGASVSDPIIWQRTLSASVMATPDTEFEIDLYGMVERKVGESILCHLTSDAPISLKASSAGIFYVASDYQSYTVEDLITGHGGVDTQVLFNDGGLIDGDPGLTYVKGTQALSLGGKLNELLIGADDDDNVFLGASIPETVGFENVALGRGALASINHANGARNTAVGHDAGASITSGLSNTMLGCDAGKALTTGIKNVLVGWSAGSALTANSTNVLVGFGTGSDLVGNANVLLGQSVGKNLVTGDGNVLIGDAVATDITDGSNNIIIGQGMDGQDAVLSDYLNIGNTIFADLALANGYVRIGRSPLPRPRGKPLGPERLRVEGATVITGRLTLAGTVSALLVNRMTAAQETALTAVNGMILYNTTTNKFRGRAGGAWVDLH